MSIFESILIVLTLCAQFSFLKTIKVVVLSANTEKHLSKQVFKKGKIA